MRITKFAVRASGRLLLAALFAAEIGIAIAEPIKSVTQSPFESCQAATLPLGAPTPLWERALQETNRCQRDAAYLAAAAQWLNAQRRYEEGQLYSERALLLDPTHVPAWIEFALGQAALGAPEAGIEALLEAREEANAQIANPLNRLDLGTDPATQVTGLTQWVSEIDELLRRYSQLVPDALDAPLRVLNAFVGYDSNFYGGPSSEQFELTLPTGPAVLPIPADLKPQKGLLAGLGISQSGVFQGSQLWRYTLHAQAKALANESSERIVFVQGKAERFDRTIGGHFVNVGLAASYVRAKLVTSNAQVAAGYELVGPWSCRLRLGAEAQLRHYPHSAGLDGNYFGLQQEGFCANGWTWQTRLGRDRPKSPAERIGGTQSQIALQLGKSSQFGNQKAVQVHFNLWRQIDQVGYSALLSDGVPRSIKSSTLRFEYQWNLKNRHVPYVAFELTNQRSNLTLFKSQNTVLQFGLRGGW